MRRLFVLAALLFALPAHASPMFMGLGESSMVTNISADGSVVVGAITGSGYRAFRWTFSEGMVLLPNPAWIALDVSADGSVIVGAADEEAFRWTETSGLLGLGNLPGRVGNSQAAAISDDGSVIAGVTGSTFGSEAFLWTESSGMIGLGELPGGDFLSSARDISADGLVVIGVSFSEFGVEAFRWTEEGGMVGLGDLEGGSFSSDAFGVSANGAVVVGSSFSFSDVQEMTRWTDEDGLVGLGRGRGYDVSADGSIIVGNGLWEEETGLTAVIWDEIHGMRSVEGVLTSLGLDLAGWTLTTATALSADGLTIGGGGINPDGNGEAWIAVIPEPTTALLLAVGLAGLAAAGRRRNH